jgi:hypothetical protein
VFDAQANKLWFGDFDLTRDRDRLVNLASAIGEPVYLTREHPYRFEPPTPSALQEAARVPGSYVVRVEPEQEAT